MGRYAVLDSDPEGMLAFAALARARGVRGAAQALGVPRSTLSRRLAELERRFGVALVARSSRRFELTEMGKRFAEHCERLEGLLAEAEDVLRRGAHEPTGKLRIDAAPVLGEEVLPEILDELLRRHPKLELSARLSADYSDLRRGQVDVALRAWPLDDASDLYALRLGTSVTGCYASPGYLRARGAPARPRDLAGHECILVGSATPVVWSFTGTRHEQRVPVHGRVRVDSFRVARGLAVRGAGILRVARLFAEAQVASGELVHVLERYWHETPLYAVHGGGQPPAPKVRALLDVARDVVGRVVGR